MPLSIAGPRAARVSMLLAFLPLVACGDEPSGPRATTTVTLCSDAPFVAYRNEGARWVRAVPTPGYTGPLGDAFTFDATPRVAIAYAWGDRPLPYLVVEHLSATQANAAHRCDDPGFIPPSTRSIGVVRPWNGVGEVQVAYGPYPYATIHFGADSVFALATPDAPSDLVAVRGAWTDALRVERMLIRRAQAYPAGSRVVLDFEADEAFALQEHAFRFDGPGAGLYVLFRTGDGREVYVDGMFVGQVGDPELSRDLTVRAVPETRLASGDLHVVRIEEVGTTTRRRRIEFATRTPRDLAMRLGPYAAVASLRTEATQPYVRVAAEIPSQPEYDAAVSIYLDQPAPLASSVLLYATREYFGGTPATWRLDVPDLAGVSGFPVNTGLKPGPIRWSLEVTSRPGLYWIPIGPPQEGQLLRWAGTDGLRP